MTIPGPRILVVDDEPQIHRFLRPALEAAGYAVERAATAAEGLRLAASRAPDAILLDLGLPDLDGQEVLTRLRGFSDVPVIVLSARDREADKIAALDGGADDYVEKPFGVGELLARIHTALRHRRMTDGLPDVVRLAGLEIDLVKRQARRGAGGPALSLSPREWALLALLARNAGRVLTHRQLLTAVWGPAHVDDVQWSRPSTWWKLGVSEAATDHAATVEICLGTASINGGASSAIASVCI
jgi:two-component system, OmpR family, KDP operon response regulator KdpE